MSAATQPPVKPIIPPLERSPNGTSVPHSLPAQGVARFFGVDPALGLSSLEVGRLVATSVKERSPLEIRLTQLGQRLVYSVLAVAFVVMIVGWLRGDGLWTMVEVGISLALAAVPEGLPAVTSLNLALVVPQMAKQKAIM